MAVRILTCNFVSMPGSSRDCLPNTSAKGSNGRPFKRHQQLKLALETGTFAHLPKDLLELVELFRSYSATDPRDKIYAILGLASALETDRLASRIDADYGLHAKGLFLEFARLVISGPDALRLLRNVHGSREQSSNLPSWVPDWSISLKIRPLAELCKPAYLLPSQRAILLKQPSLDVLKLVGKRIDTIKAVGEVLNESSGEASLQIWNSWMSLGRKHGLTPPEAFNWDAFSIPQDYRGFREFQEYSYLQTKIPKHCSEICFGRRYLLTKQSRSGLVPAGAKVGDEIILFPGAELPFVVGQDKSDNMFYIVGECYLDRVFLDSLMQEKVYKRGVYYLK